MSKEVIGPQDEPNAVLCLVHPNHNEGPFYLLHPDFQVSNFLFDSDYNVTALLDWSGCQTVPLESFANPPGKIIPNDDKFLDGWVKLGLLPDDMRMAWGERRRLFLQILEDCELARSDMAPIAGMMKSPRPYFAACLDSEGILGIARSLPKEEFERFCLEQTS
jgi:hypothetical protein